MAEQTPIQEPHEPQIDPVHARLEALANLPVNRFNLSQGSFRDFYEEMLVDQAKVLYGGDVEEARKRFRDQLLKDAREGFLMGDTTTAARILVADVPPEQEFEIFEGKLLRDLELSVASREVTPENAPEREGLEIFIEMEEESLADFRALAGRRTDAADTY